MEGRDRSGLPTLCGGRFTLRGTIGRGATSTVYLADDRQTHGRVALKVVSGTLDRSHGARTLHREARATRARPHPGLVAAREILGDAGLSVAVLEYVEGADLRQLLEARGRLRGDQALRLLHGALAGLSHLHRHGMVHGDVKPENILVSTAGTTKLADLGQWVRSGTTARGGSPGYVSPEARAGERVDRRSDVYSLGAVLYECLVGRPPIRVRSGAAEWTAPSRLQPALLRSSWRALLRSAMAEDPARRPPSVEAFLAQATRATRRWALARERRSTPSPASTGRLVRPGVG